jgi:hypothetical protein
MAKDTPSFTELTHQVVRESPEPLPFREILRRVHAIAPITTRNPEGTIRSAIGQSRLIVATGDGRYGWKPRLITGSVLRLTLSESEVNAMAQRCGTSLPTCWRPGSIGIRSRLTPSRSSGRRKCGGPR